MNQTNTNTLLFNDKNIVYKRIKGVYWITLKSVCEALNVNFNRQFQNIKEDPILGPKFAKQQIMVPGDSQPRSFICLPEEYIYGWIFSIRSESSELVEYKRECYHILYSHFHGTITRRTELYKELALSEKRRLESESRLRNNPDFAEWEAQKMKIARLWKNIRVVSDEDRVIFDDDEFE